MRVQGELKNLGAGHPDVGMFTVKSGERRGVVETKAPGEPVDRTAASEQVARYVGHYGVVLVTNYWEFLVVTADGPELAYRLAPGEAAFWSADPGELADRHADGLTEFLGGAMTRAAPLTRPAELAAALAGYAQEAGDRLAAADTSRLDALRRQMEKALDLSFGTPEGEAFFRGSLIQTLFYGLFSGWVLWRRETGGTAGGADPFQWQNASEYLALPLIGDLYEDLAGHRKLGRLNLLEPLDWATRALGRVDEEAFFAKFDADHAITLFYEPFLERFDPALRRELGVWYTPPEVVRYMVRRADAVLRDPDGLNLPDGLADPAAFVLDPAAGTGSYLIEAARVIYERRIAQGEEPAMAGDAVREALTTRVFGFEILTAPYVVAHLQLALLLRELKAPLSARQRCGVFLTNALTGWRREKDGTSRKQDQTLFQMEADGARRVKQREPVLVIFGNPPYDAFASVDTKEETKLVEPYKKGLRTVWNVKRQLLNDLYVRFYRVAERRIAEHTGRGVVCFITNSNWLDGLSHVVMREHLLQGFDEIYVDDLHGNRLASERAPDGASSETLFAMSGGYAGIQTGTAIGTLVKDPARDTGEAPAAVFRRDFTAASAAARRANLLAAGGDAATLPYRVVPVSAADRWVLDSTDHRPAWSSWTALPDLFDADAMFKGVQPGRRGATVEIDREPLERRMRDYFDQKLSHHEVRSKHPKIMSSEARYEPEDIRKRMFDADNLQTYQDNSIVPCEWLPFDTRLLYWQPTGKLLNEKRRTFQRQVFVGNRFLACAQKPRKGRGAWSPPLACETLGSYYLLDPYATYFPLRMRREGFKTAPTPGFHPDVLGRLCGDLGVPLLESDSDRYSNEAFEWADRLFAHLFAVQWSPLYADENADSLARDWARVPIPADRDVLTASAALGDRVQDLLLTTRAVRGVTAGDLPPAIRGIAVLARSDGKPVEPGTDTAVTVGWYRKGRAGSVSAGKGRVTPTEADPTGAVDVWLNDKTLFSSIPLPVWEMEVGGYPVLKKWLSYREEKILGRPLTVAECRHFTHAARRLAALLALGDELDANYRACRGSAAG